MTSNLTVALENKKKSLLSSKLAGKTNNAKLPSFALFLIKFLITLNTLKYLS